MAKNNAKPKTPNKPRDIPAVAEVHFLNPQKLLVGVNFIALGETEETRIEAGIIEAGTLPPAFEQMLRGRKQLI